jgi:hypothetical protein
LKMADSNHSNITATSSNFISQNMSFRCWQYWLCNGGEGRDVKCSANVLILVGYFTTLSIS